jgi:sensor histidine kinase YesM
VNAKERRLTWALVFGGWTLAGLVYSSHLYVFHTLRGEATTWPLQLAEALADFYVWAALTPLVVAISRRFPLEARTWRRSLPILLVSGLCVSLLQVALHAVVDQTLIHANYDLASIADGFAALFARTYHFGLLVYGAIVATHQAAIYFQNQRLAASRLEAQLARARLAALEMQLHPHFLFNTLNAVSTLMRRDVDAAERVVARLGDLLRATLALEGVEQVRLEQELDLLGRYLEIEKVRFGERLRIETHIDPAALDARVPSLILQPLVENAVKHGISKRRGVGTIEVRATRDNGTLRLSVADDGVGLSEGAGEGVGLANTRARLEALYGPRGRFDLRPRSGGGLEAAIRIPYLSGEDDGTDPRAHR